MPAFFEYLSALALGPEVHVLDASVSKGGRQPLVRVVVDTPAGITIDEIAKISQLVRRDPGVAKQVGTTDFRLEVTSPGVKAGLTEPWQYPRHVGRRLIVRLHPPIGEDESATNIEGQLLRTGPKGIVLERSEGEEEIAWERIQQAVVQLKW